MRNWDKVPDEVKEAIRYEVARNGLERVDNHRAYRHQDEFLKHDFNESRRNGDSHLFEHQYITLNGEKWIIGCNYEHCIY